MTIMGFFVFILVMFITWSVCYTSQQAKIDDAAERAKYVRTNESYLQASNDMIYLTQRQFRKRLESHYYDTLKEQCWQDRAGGWHLNGVEKPRYFYNHID